MDIVLAPDDRLKQKCISVDKITQEHKDTAREMYKFMVEKDGIGLAANQVGLDMRLIVLKHEEKPIYMFNPVVLQSSKNQYKFEGCLSFPGEIKKCRRAQLVMVKYKDINGKLRTGQYQGLTARCIQHEIDHLNGVTYDEREKHV